MSKAWLTKNFNPYQGQVLVTALAIAQQRNLQLYAVGGIVRDWLLLNTCPNLPLASQESQEKASQEDIPDWPDLDLVVVGCPRAGILVANALHHHYPDSKLQIHEKFQTAELIWHPPTTAHQFTLDLATARTETYSHPGANPDVQAASLIEDLHRRDFTINAIAIPLTDNQDPEIIDPHQGITDLQQKKICAIRQGSFLEDPRRIYRAVRFAVRFGFELHPDTEQEIRHTTAGGIHNHIGGSRLQAEIYYLLAYTTTQVSQMWRSLAALGALDCIYAPFPLDPHFAQCWRRWQRWQSCFASLFLDLSQKSPEIDFLFLLSDLGIVFAQTPDQTPNFQLSSLQITQLRQIGQLTNLQLSQTEAPSHLVHQLEQFHPLSLLIYGTKTQEHYRRQIIWQYLHQWRQIQSPLDGKTLIQLGCPKGKNVGQLLQILRDAALDRQVSSQHQAIQLAQSWIDQLV